MPSTATPTPEPCRPGGAATTPTRATRPWPAGPTTPPRGRTRPTAGGTTRTPGPTPGVGPLTTPSPGGRWRVGPLTTLTPAAIARWACAGAEYAPAILGVIKVCHGMEARG